MARTALNGPAHRVMQRLPPADGAGAAQSAPSIDMGGAGLQDPRLRYNTANSSVGAQVVGWYSGAPLIDAVPSTITTTALAALAVPVSGTAMTLVAATGAGITVSSSAIVALPSLVTIPSGSRFIDGLLSYVRFGTKDFTVFYDPTVMLSRCISIASVGNDTGAVMNLVGFDVYGYTIHETVTMGTGATVNSKKAFKGLYSATPVGTLSGSNVSIGCSDIFGLPLQAARQSMTAGFWNNLILQGTGTFVAGVTTNPATATTGDVRGTLLLGSASNNTKRLTLSVFPDPSLQSSQGMVQGLAGVTQF